MIDLHRPNAGKHKCLSVLFAGLCLVCGGGQDAPFGHLIRTPITGEAKTQQPIGIALVDRHALAPS